MKPLWTGCHFDWKTVIVDYRKEGPEETGQNGHRSWNYYMEGKIEWIWMVCLWKKRLREDKVVFKYIKGRK